MHASLLNLVILLGTAVLFVPLTKRLHLSSVTGYLLGGVLIGPWGLGWIPDSKEILEVAEFGVVFLLFLLGLELQPRRIWELRYAIFGMGGLQLLLSAAALTAAAWSLGLEFRAALLCGLVLSFSSTAVALQLAEERGLLHTEAGHKGIAVLLLQDIAVIPLLALLPLFGAGGQSSLHLDGREAVLALGLVLAIVLMGRPLLRPLFRVIAETRSREIFTAFSLLLVMGVALLLNAVGMSLALGAFIGGVVLAESEYRHEVEIDVEPFKGLLMGLFFIAIGMSLDLGPWLRESARVLELVVGLLVVKLAVMGLLAKAFRMHGHQSWLVAALLCQGGEFGFVVFGEVLRRSLLDPALVDLLMVVIASSMVATPLVLALAERMTRWRLHEPHALPEPTPSVPASNPVIIAGFGRYGQVIDRFLAGNGVRSTVIDHDPAQIELLRRFGHQVLYGDATRIDLLRAAGAEQAKLLIIALDDADATTRLVDLARRHFPDLPLLIRVRNRTHAYEMLERGIQDFERETFPAALNTAVKALLKMGFDRQRASEAARLFHRHDEATLRRLQPVHRDQEKLITAVEQARLDLEQLMNAETASSREIPS
ncbi:MAG TPA: monovalent cation:proton antiporter-2 (CPA2) family protein [Gammaproteobacteria bacterium]|nr:monovalent cation:proton antiporter-2 (CPA2) family protein [Gammaproteobacteria bacterium]